MGISTLQLTDGQQVIEFNRFEDCRSEPEVISMKMNFSVIRGNTFHNCVGSLSCGTATTARSTTTGSSGSRRRPAAAYNRTSAGPRRTGRGTKIHHNTIQVNGDGGSRPSATSLFESPLTLDSGDVAPGSTSNGHANLVGVTVENNLLVKCGQPDLRGGQLLDGPDGHGPEQLGRGVRARRVGRGPHLRVEPQHGGSDDLR
jgi:hypothetical protein